MIWHVIPINDLKPHEQSSTCECLPSVEVVESGDMIVTHTAYDGRE